MTPRSLHAQIEDDSRQAGVPIVGARYHLRPGHDVRALQCGSPVRRSPCCYSLVTTRLVRVATLASQPIPIARGALAAEQLRVPCGLRSGIASLASQAVSAVPVKFVRDLNGARSLGLLEHSACKLSDALESHDPRTSFVSFGCYAQQHRNERNGRVPNSRVAFHKTRGELPNVA